jgi:antitoxin (DNA-binding transcriptional repressor) of toxin-antitoxin stability system
MKTIDLTSQVPSIEELLTLARAQAGVLLTKRGQPVAQVLPMPEMPRQRVAPLHPGAWEVREDFDEPLAEEFLMGRP